jgi:hypothetical protein
MCSSFDYVEQHHRADLTGFFDGALAVDAETGVVTLIDRDALTHAVESAMVYRKLVVPATAYAFLRLAVGCAAVRVSDITGFDFCPDHTADEHDPDEYFEQPIVNATHALNVNIGTDDWNELMAILDGRMTGYSDQIDAVMAELTQDIMLAIALVVHSALQLCTLLPQRIAMKDAIIAILAGEASVPSVKGNPLTIKFFSLLKLCGAPTVPSTVTLPTVQDLCMFADFVLRGAEADPESRGAEIELFVHVGNPMKAMAILSMYHLAGVAPPFSACMVDGRYVTCAFTSGCVLAIDYDMPDTMTVMGIDFTENVSEDTDLHELGLPEEMMALVQVREFWLLSPGTAGDMLGG